MPSTVSNPKRELSAVISVRLSTLGPSIAARTTEMSSASLVVKRELGRYYRLLADASRELSFTLDEARMLVTLIEPEHDVDLYRYLPKEIECRSARVPDRATMTTLVRKLSSLSPVACLAVIDMVERYHLLGGDESRPAEHEVEALIAVGLLERHAPAAMRVATASRLSA
jgi:hypothetical protein